MGDTRGLSRAGALAALSHPHLNPLPSRERREKEALPSGKRERLSRHGRGEKEETPPSREKGSLPFAGES